VKVKILVRVEDATEKGHAKKIAKQQVAAYMNTLLERVGKELITSEGVEDSCPSGEDGIFGGWQISAREDSVGETAKAEILFPACDPSDLGESFTVNVFDGEKTMYIQVDLVA
jgi:hypothetical protein